MCGHRADTCHILHISNEGDAEDCHVQKKRYVRKGGEGGGGNDIWGEGWYTSPPFPKGIGVNTLYKDFDA